MGSGLPESVNEVSGGLLAPGSSVLVAGGRVTGQAVLATLAELGVMATVCDEDAAVLQRHADA